VASVLSHPAVPLAVAVALGPTRVPPALTAVACAASILPDIDALGFMAGIPYGHPLGHRGFTHSIVFALLAGAAAVQLGTVNYVRPEAAREVYNGIAEYLQEHGFQDLGALPIRSSSVLAHA